jgi:hypothetical protein
MQQGSGSPLHPIFSEVKRKGDKAQCFRTSVRFVLSCCRMFQAGFRLCAQQGVSLARESPAAPSLGGVRGQEAGKNPAASCPPTKILQL